VASRRLGATAGFPVPTRWTAHTQRLISEERDQPFLGVVALPAEGCGNLWIEPRDCSRDQCRIASGACQEFEAAIQDGLHARRPSFARGSGGKTVRDALHAHAQSLDGSDAQLIQGHAREAGH